MPTPYGISEDRIDLVQAVAGLHDPSKRAYEAARDAVASVGTDQYVGLNVAALELVVADATKTQPPLPDSIISVASRVLEECNGDAGPRGSNFPLVKGVVSAVFEYGYGPGGFDLRDELADAFPPGVLIPAEQHIGPRMKAAARIPVDG